MTRANPASWAPPGPGVPLELAQERAQRIQDLSYSLTLQLPASGDVPYKGSMEVSFTLEDTSQPLALDFARPSKDVLGLRLNQRELEPWHENEHLILPAEHLEKGVNSATIEFQTTGAALHRQEDLVYALFVPAWASHDLPVFDQPDLKARWQLELVTPESWTALSNAPLKSREVRETGLLWKFSQSQPLSTYQFSFVAGLLQVEETQHNGRRLRLFHQESNQEKVQRNTESIFQLHKTALDWLEDYTGISMPYEKFDFVLIPAFPFGGMEHPGAIDYRAELLWLEADPTREEELRRASLIAHETAHMWFGNLVTMRWFNDVWTKEVFANFMADRIVQPSFPDLDHRLRFFLDHAPSAYGVDRSAGANPIRQPLDNLAEAGSVYGSIIYDKAPMVMEQLEMLLGPDRLREGLREYLQRYSHANATWPELIDLLDQRTETDLSLWSQVWVEEPGRPEVRVEWESDGKTLQSLTIVQRDPAGKGRQWHQALEVVLVTEEGETALPVQLNAERVEIHSASGLPRPDFILANGQGAGYGHFVLDARSLEFLKSHPRSSSSPRTRVLAWMSLYEAVLFQQLEPLSLMNLGLRLLNREGNDLVAEHVLGDLEEIWRRFLTPEQQLQLALRLESILWSGSLEAASPSLRRLQFRVWSRVSRTPQAIARLSRILSQEEVLPELEISPRERLGLLLELAIRQPEDAPLLVERELESLEDPELKKQLEFLRPALSSSPQERQRFFQALLQPENRRKEPWVARALELLHHPLRAQESLGMIRPGLEELEELQRTGTIFFPKRWLDALLFGHGSRAAEHEIRGFLEENPQLNPRLRQKLLQSADSTFRAASWRSALEE